MGDEFCASAKGRTGRYFQGNNLHPFRLDRIKSEHPTFQEAINNLKMPPNLPELERMKM